VNFGIVLASREEFEQAAVLYDRACTGGLTAGCHHLAAAAEKGEGIPQDGARAVSLYDEACGADYVDSCLALATLYADGTAVEADPAKVTEYYGKALKIYSDGCEAGDTRDCAERDRLRTRITLLAARPPSAPKGPGGGDR
jgi:TPR repeat protein